MTALWTAAEAAEATGGEARGDWRATGVSIDTRTLERGDLFVALRDVRDGHDFVAQALLLGASAALVSRVPEDVPIDAPILLVADVLKALEALARSARARSRAKVIGITGSVGKTSTKDMAREVLARQGKVHAAEKSYNNHWGVPLTLARMPPDADYAVIEIGMNHPGEIAPLARLAQLDVAVVTTVAPAHLEAFDSVEDIAREKASIMDGLRAGGTAVLNADVPTARILCDRAAMGDARIVRFGTVAGADLRLVEAAVSDGITVVKAEVSGAPILFKIATPGRHLAMNALAVLAACTAVGADAAVAACDLGSWSPPEGRGKRERLVLDIVEDHLTIDLIDDAYNANPASMAAALDVLAAANPTHGVGRIAAGRRIAVLGDMLELGRDEMQFHADLAGLPAIAAIDLVHCVGPRMRALWGALQEHQRGNWSASAEELAGRARHIADAGDVVLVKGSKGSKVSLIVDALRKLGHDAPSEIRDGA